MGIELTENEIVDRANEILDEQRVLIIAGETHTGKSELLEKLIPVENIIFGEKKEIMSGKKIEIAQIECIDIVGVDEGGYCLDDLDTLYRECIRGGRKLIVVIQDDSYLPTAFSDVSRIRMHFNKAASIEYGGFVGTLKMKKRNV